jgi:single-strand DNA-binding protein
MYQPKIKDSLIRRLYQAANRRGLRMTHVLNAIVETALGQDERDCDGEECDPGHLQEPAQERRDTMSLNRATVIGYLGQDPEIRYTQAGTPVATFSVATSRRWTNEHGPQEKTEWHRIVVWNKLAENCAQYLAKGRQVYVEGSLQTRSYEDKDGVVRKITEIIASQVQFLGKSEGVMTSTAAGAGSVEPDGLNEDVPF